MQNFVFVKIPFADGEEISVDLTVSQVYGEKLNAHHAAKADAHITVVQLIDAEVEDEMVYTDAETSREEIRDDVTANLDYSVEVEFDRIIIWQGNELPVFQYVIKEIG